MFRRIAGLIGVLCWAAAFAAAPVVAPKTWVQFTPNISDVYENPSPGGSGRQNVINAWSGGAYNDSSEQLIVWGGGHGDYYGNEIYVFDLDSSTQAWRKERAFSGTIDVGEAAETTCRYTADEQSPRSRHTYNYLQWMGNVNRFISAGCKDPATGALASPAVVQAYDFVARTWDERAANPHTTTLSGQSVSAYDRQTGFLWFYGVAAGGRLVRYNYNTDAWTEQGDPDNNSGQLQNGTSCDIDTSFTPNRMYCTGAIGTPGTGLVRYFVLDTTDSDIDSVRVTVTGETSCSDQLRPGFVWSPRDSLFFCWSGGANVFTFNPRTAVWDSIPPDAGNTVTPSAAASNGTFGRFRYSPRYGLFVAVNSTTGNTFVYRYADTTAAVSGPPIGSRMLMGAGK